MFSLADKFVTELARLAPFGRHDTDPLSSPRAAARWLEGLPVGDAFKCQQAILGALGRFNENSTTLTKDRLAVLMLLDEKSRDLQDTLVRQYLRNPRMSRPHENQLWHAVYGLYWEVARAYHAAVLQFARDADHGQPQPVFPLIALRAIRSFGQLLKWRAIRYLPAGDKLWQRLHKLYRVAEGLDFHRLPQRAYDGEDADCSCESAYLHILMLSLADAGTLYPRQVDLIDRWLCGWHVMLELDRALDPGRHTFAVDLSADHGPRRVRNPGAGRPLRAWSTPALVDRLHVLQAALRDGGLPAQLGLTDAVRPAEAFELLEHLQRQWSPLEHREQRRAARDSTKRLVDVVHGLGAIVDQLKTAGSHDGDSVYETGLSFAEAEEMQVYGFVTGRTREHAIHARQAAPDSTRGERWVMHDESAFGYGAVVESVDKDWLRVGALIAVKPHHADAWKIGIVRRLARPAGDSCAVGIETLAEPPVLATLHDTSQPGYTVNGFDNSGASQPRACIWLAGAGATDSLMIDPAHYTPGKVFEMHGVPGRSVIALGNPVERSEGWLRVAAAPVAG